MACDAAKAKGVTVFTIAFKISNNATAKKLSECASSPAHAYRANGLDIADAFQSIAATIKKLRLIG